MNDIPAWSERPHNIIIGTAGRPLYPRIMYFCEIGAYTAEVWEGQRGFALSVYTEPQRAPDIGDDGKFSCIYGRKCLSPEVLPSLQEAQRRGEQLIDADRKGLLDFAEDADSGWTINVIRPEES